MLAEGLLQRRQLAVVAGQALDVVIDAPSAWTARRQQLLTASPSSVHGAGAAAAGVAADVRARQVELVAQEVDEQHRRGDLALVASSR